MVWADYLSACVYTSISYSLNYNNHGAGSADESRKCREKDSRTGFVGRFARWPGGNEERLRAELRKPPGKGVFGWLVGWLGGAPGMATGRLER